MNWTDKVKAWRRLKPEDRRAIWHRRIPRDVALSMAFEGEPVDLQWLKNLQKRLDRRGS